MIFLLFRRLTGLRLALGPGRSLASASRSGPSETWLSGLLSFEPARTKRVCACKHQHSHDKAGRLLDTSSTGWRHEHIKLSLKMAPR